LVVKLPKDLVPEFAMAVHKLASDVKPLRFHDPKRIFSDCRDPNCVWKYTSNSVDTLGRHSGERSFNDLHKSIMKAKYDVRPYFYRGTLKNVVPELKTYTDKLYMDAFILLESLEPSEAQTLRRDIKKFASFLRETIGFHLTQDPKDETKTSLCCWTVKNVQMGSTIIDQFANFERMDKYLLSTDVSKLNTISQRKDISEKRNVYEMAECCHKNGTHFFQREFFPSVHCNDVCNCKY